jgi:hypothetical protein
VSFGGVEWFVVDFWGVFGVGDPHRVHPSLERQSPRGPIRLQRRLSKTRRDSSVSELETKLKDVKALNSKYRKTLLDKESELQVIVCDWGASVSSVFLPSDVDQAVGQRGQGDTRLEDGLDERHQQTVGAAAAEGGPQCHRD